jgi:hypothetical protein
MPFKDSGSQGSVGSEIVKNSRFALAAGVLDDRHTELAYLQVCLFIARTYHPRVSEVDQNRLMVSSH